MIKNNRIPERYSNKLHRVKESQRAMQRKEREDMSACDLTRATEGQLSQRRGQEDALRIPLSLEALIAEKEEQAIKEEDENPMNTPISQLLTERAAERRRMMKEFNYKFHSNQSRIDEIEKQPAYKRMGVNLDDAPNSKGSISRTSLSTDENDEMQLRRNNSFLHDNVD